MGEFEISSVCEQLPEQWDLRDVSAAVINYFFIR